MKNILITWHYTTHGLAYLKHILSAFHKHGIDKFPLEKLSQEELHTEFDKAKNGFKFDEIILLYPPQTALDNLTQRRFKYKDSTYAKDDVIKAIPELAEAFKAIRNDDDICYTITKELAFIQKNYPEQLDNFRKYLWRDMQHYPMEEQLKWFQEMSNFSKVYPSEGVFNPVYLKKATNLRDEGLIIRELYDWLKKYLKKQTGDFQLFINVSLGSNETGIVWHSLGEAHLLPPNTTFIKTYDDKNAPEQKFKSFNILKTPTNLVSSITKSLQIFEETKAIERNLVNKKLEVFLDSGFTIFLLGERGLGKSNLVNSIKEAFGVVKGEIIEVNCASFDDDNKSESAFFGHKKGAFTGATEEKTGLIKEAENGILFLDEIHHLSKYVQAKLLRVFQTNDKNELTIKKMGATKDEQVRNVRLIFASNKSIEELNQYLLPDFYDRIVQHVIEIPALRNAPEDREKDWESVWQRLKLSNPYPKEDKNLLAWIKELPLYGNYRDLQKIAMYYDAFQQFDAETKNFLKEKTAFEYAEKEFTKYHNLKNHGEVFNFDNLTEYNFKAIEKDFLTKLEAWATQKWTRKEAAERLGVVEKTLNNWKNK